MSLLFKKDQQRILSLPLDAVRPNPDQPRRFFDPEGLEELANSIRALGILQPLTVRQTQDGWELVAGERRLRAAALAGLKEKMLQGVTLKANDNFDGGFRIAVNNGSAYYDYSAEAVVDMLSNYLSPKVTQLLKEAE